MNRILNFLAFTLLTSFLISGSATLSLTNFNEESGTVDIYMVNDTPVGGVQFDLSGLDGMNASGGSAGSAGFTVSTGGSTILGFSFSGATIPVGEGVLFTVTGSPNGDNLCLSLGNGAISDSGGVAQDVTFGDCIIYGDNPVVGCTDSSACNYNPDATDDDGSCDYGLSCWDGSSACDLSDCPEEPGGTVDITFDSDTPIAGFQFNVDGVTLNGASGGAAADAGFTVSSGGTTVIGFS